MKKVSYQTIKNPSQGLFKDRGSKFLSFAFPVSNEDEIKKILDKLRAEYHDARHHCFAWRLGPEKEHFRTGDDGEPSGTAGKPVLGQIQKNDLTNILIVVVRYFGGTLLGTGGLVNAYRSAAADAIMKSKIITRATEEILELKFPYSSMSQVMKVLKEEQAEQLEQDFKTDCKIRVRLLPGKMEKVVGRMENIESVEINKLSIIC